MPVNSGHAFQSYSVARFSAPKLFDQDKVHDNAKNTVFPSMKLMRPSIKADNMLSF